MKYKKVEEYQFLAEEGQIVYKVKEKAKEIHVFIKSKKRLSACPSCKQKSDDQVCVYERTVQDTPIKNKKVILHLKASKYRCHNENCTTKVFNERSELVLPRQRRTERLNLFILSISIFMSDYMTSLILSLLGVEISHDTVRRLRDRVVFKDHKEVKEIGVDDVALRKGQTYATAVYDLEDGDLITLLPDRTKEVLKEFLTEHQKIEVAARDRASAYASALEEELPDCVQVADRFHLLQNFIETLKDIFYKELPNRFVIKDGEIISPKKKVPDHSLEDLKDLDYDNSDPVGQTGQVILFDKRRKFHKKEEFERLKKKQEDKISFIKEIRSFLEDHPERGALTLASKTFDLSVTRIRELKLMSTEEIEALRDPNRRLHKAPTDSCINIIYKMLRDGFKPKAIIDYITIVKEIKIPVEMLNNTISCVRNNNFVNRHDHKSSTLTRRSILKTCLIRDKTQIKEEVRRNVELVLEDYPYLKFLTQVFDEFYRIIMGDEPDELKEFLEKYSQDDKLSAFIQGLKKDYEAVRNAIVLPISSGIVEGNNNKLKFLKRIVYGRANLVNLENRCRLAFGITKDDFSLKLR